MLCKTRWIGINGDIHEFNELSNGFHNRHWIDEFNKYCEYYYYILGKNLRGCKHIKMPKETICWEGHRWGLQPYHFTEEFDKYVAKSIDEIVTENKIGDN